MLGNMLIKYINVSPQQLHACLHHSFVSHVFNWLYGGLQADEEPINLILIQGAFLSERMSQPFQQANDALDFRLV
jgi:hypothetical protein